MLQKYPVSGDFFAVAQLRNMRGSEQVAAVCFRRREGKIEFLLVETRGGRWTFPKGSAEPGLTHAQAAALEAFEEAGVHGRIEKVSFASYYRQKRHSLRQVDPVRIVVHAHLCEVLGLEQPQESGRNPTWLYPDKAKRRLKKDRAADYGSQLSRIVDLAVVRIQQMHSSPRLSLNRHLRLLHS